MGTDWSGVYRSTFQDLVRFLYRKVWDEDRAMELAQETFVRALREEPQNPRSWLFTVARNLAMDEARTAIRRKQHLTLLEGEAADKTSPSPADELAERERGERLRRALELLSDRDREVLELWDAGLNYRDIAEQTGLSAGAIGTTLARARQRLVAAHEDLEAGHVARQ